MKDTNSMFKTAYSRRKFLNQSVKAGSALALLPLLGCTGGENPTAEIPYRKVNGDSWDSSGRSVKERVGGDVTGRILLKNGLLVDGTGEKAFYGDLLVNGDKIETITPHDLQFDGKVIDCTGLVIAPGFIDMHSHMDWVLPIEGQPELKMPYTAQGITTFVGGNCGFGTAGFAKDSRYMDILKRRTADLYDINWRTMDQYFTRLNTTGMSHNLINLSGYGTTRASIRGFDPTPLKPEEQKELMYLLEEALEQGAVGVSLGLQYEPGVFAKMDELEQVARMVKKKEKILTVHMKAYSSVSGTYPLKVFGRPHNLLAIEDMLNLARKTGVKLQLSHLIFVGKKTWGTYEEALGLIDDAIKEGVDVKFDTYAYHCGTSIINVFMPEWFLSQMPEVYNDKKALWRLYAELQAMILLLGFGYDDIQITDAKIPELEEFNGLFVSESAKKRGMSSFDNFIDFARKSGGSARVLNHRYSSLENVLEMMKHPASLFMTDATVAREGVQNPGAFGNFPRFLQYARDYDLLSLEAVVHKMTGASAERFQVKDRGVLKKGLAADITVFDWKRVKDNNTDHKTDNRPDGIEMVFINGTQVVNGPEIDSTANDGVVV
jgi:N-acyl-D-amino-acid deacylase